MAELTTRLQAVRPLVETIRTVSGAASLSVGIIHEGKLVSTDNFGFRNVKDNIPPDQDTIYYLSSLSKSFTAAGIGHLVNQSPKFTWDTPIIDVFPAIKIEDPEVRQHATIVDFLSHRTGLAPKNHLWNHEFAHLTMRRGEDIRMINYLNKIASFRTRLIYNNWGYAVADELIEYLSGTSFGQFLRDRILDPLGLKRTVTRKQEHDDNVAKPYVAMSNGESYELEDPDGEDGEILSGAIGVRSCVRDLSRYYTAFMRAVKADKTGTSSSDFIRPFSDAEKLVEPYIALTGSTEDPESTYGLGWAIASLPGPLGFIGMNDDYVVKMPTVAKGIPHEITCYYHNGCASSALSSVYLLPDTESGVVVLANSMALNDVADWVGQLYLETILDSPVKNDYVKLAKESALASLALWPAMHEQLAKKRIPGSSSRRLSRYVGKYYNTIGNYHLAIFEKDDRLLLRMPAERNIVYELMHYHYDSFTWLLTYEQNAKLGRFPIPRASFYILHFGSRGQDDSEIDSLVWPHDDRVLEGETFYRLDGQCAHMIGSSPIDHPEKGLERESASIARIASDLGGSVELIRADTHQGSAWQEVAVIKTEPVGKFQPIVAGAERLDSGKL